MPLPCHAFDHYRRKLLFIIFIFLPQFQQKRDTGEMAEEKNATIAPQAPIFPGVFFCAAHMIFFVRKFRPGPSLTLATSQQKEYCATCVTMRPQPSPVLCLRIHAHPQGPGTGVMVLRPDSGVYTAQWPVRSRRGPEPIFLEILFFIPFVAWSVSTKK